MKEITDGMVNVFITSAKGISENASEDLKRQWRDFRNRQDEVKITLKGQNWYIRNDGYRFWLRPAETNPQIDKEPISLMEYKHNDGPMYELAEEIMLALEQRFKEIYK